jgi:hypothetical protein
MTSDAALPIKFLLSNFTSFKLCIVCMHILSYHIAEFVLCNLTFIFLYWWTSVACLVLTNFALTLITNKYTQKILSSIVTHSYIFDTAGSSSGRTFCYRYTKVALYSWVRMCCWPCTGGVNSLRSRPALQACRPGPQRIHASENNAVRSQQHTLTQL